MAKSSNKSETNPSAYKKKHWEEICDKTRNCSFCPPHRSENARKHPRTSKYKNVSRKSIRKEDSRI